MELIQSAFSLCNDLTLTHFDIVALGRHAKRRGVKE